MLNLKLRDEFLGSQMPGTAITLRRGDNTGAAQQSPDQILSITYPTADVHTALRAVSTERVQRPIVLMGDRDRGKSHIMAVMHHAIQSPGQEETWVVIGGNQQHGLVVLFWHEGARVELYQALRARIRVPAARIRVEP